MLFRDLGGEAVLLDVASGSYFGLNEVGARVWRLITEGKTLPEVAAALAAEYAVPGEQLQADLLALVEDLAANRLLVVEGA